MSQNEFRRYRSKLILSKGLVSIRVFDISLEQNSNFDDVLLQEDTVIISLSGGSNTEL